MRWIVGYAYYDRTRAFKRSFLFAVIESLFVL
ncbi:hypothetical protein MOLA814_00045 [Betaproteobacteria bacterium MOLA814]|nr:hypothetical protein MOLA814_00045 [Betaproteobacteria bacterium MOLA814]